MPLPAAVALGAKALPYVATGLSAILGRPKKRKNTVGKTVAKYMAMRANGYVTDEDKAAAGRVTQRVARQAGSQRRADEASTLNRMSRTGQIGSGAQERAIQQIADREAVGLENAGLYGADAEYGAYNRNKGFEENKIYQGMAAETRNAEAEAARGDLQTSTFWNSMLDLTQQLAPLYPSSSPTAPTAAAPAAPTAPAAPSRLGVPRLQSAAGSPRLNAAPAAPTIGRRMASRMNRNAGQFAYSG